MFTEGKGSILLAFDFVLDDESDVSLVLNPKVFFGALKKAVPESGMTLREGFLDVWENPTSGPMSAFISIAESHIRVETWPDELHVNGEVQLCHYSRDNSKSAVGILERIQEMINPGSGQILRISRGPGPMLTPEIKVTFRRGQPLVVEGFSAGSPNLSEVLLSGTGR